MQEMVKLTKPPFMNWSVATAGHFISHFNSLGPTKTNPRQERAQQ